MSSNTDQNSQLSPSEREAYQRHHDHFVALKASGKLTEADQSNYDLAMLRERQGLVEPLPIADPMP